MPRIQRGRNTELAPGVMLHTRSQMRAVAGRYKHIGKGGAKKPAAAPAEPKTRWFPTDDEPKPLKRLFRPKAAKLRSSITPGTVLIVLAGRFRGKRVVFLRQLPSGLLLVTGPFKVNGVPLRRLNQAYVIATSTKVDISSLTLPEEVERDSFYVESKKEKEERRRKARTGEAAFFSKEDVPAQDIPQARKDVQKQVDEQILALPELQDKVVRAYLGARFSLSKHEHPHDMKF